VGVPISLEGPCVPLAHPAGGLRRPGCLASMAVVHLGGACHPTGGRLLFLRWNPGGTNLHSDGIFVDDRMKGQTPRATRWRSSSSAAPQPHAHRLCLRRLLSVAAQLGATTTIVDLMGRRHRSIAPTRNNNPAQPHSNSAACEPHLGTWWCGERDSRLSQKDRRERPPGRINLVP